MYSRRALNSFSWRTQGVPSVAAAIDRGSCIQGKAHAEKHCPFAAGKLRGNLHSTSEAKTIKL
jgi:hypothetical protein